MRRSLRVRRWVVPTTMSKMNTTSSRSTRTHTGEPLPLDDRLILGEEHRKFGAGPLANRIGISRSTLEKLLLGGRCHRSVILLVQRALQSCRAK